MDVCIERWSKIKTNTARQTASPAILLTVKVLFRQRLRKAVLKIAFYHYYNFIYPIEQIPLEFAYRM